MDTGALSAVTRLQAIHEIYEALSVSNLTLLLLAFYIIDPLDLLVKGQKFQIYV